MLYKNINRFDDICLYLPLYFVLIVWLRFVNHLLNYYLLTYLLLPVAYHHSAKAVRVREGSGFGIDNLNNIKKYLIGGAANTLDIPCR